jgi:hypothetical protein
MALGHLLYGNNSGIELTEVLGLDLEKWTALKIEKLDGVIADIKKLLH